MARFIMSNRRAGKFHPAQKAASIAAVDQAWNDILKPSARNAAGMAAPGKMEKRRTILFDADPAEMLARRGDLPADVMLEPEVLFHRSWTYPLLMQNLRTAAPGPSGAAPLDSGGGIVWPLSNSQDGGGIIFPLSAAPGGGIVWPPFVPEDGIFVPLSNLPRGGGIVWPTGQGPARNSFNTVPTGTGVTVRIRVTGQGRPVEGARLELLVRGNGIGRMLAPVFTDEQGWATMRFGRFWHPSMLVVVPKGGFWTWMVHAPENNAVIELEVLPKGGPLGWWHRAVGIDKLDLKLGDGVRIGVIDTGEGPHPNLDRVNGIGACVNDTFLTALGATHDADTHGSHVCGIIGARPGRKGDYAGIAPGAQVLAARVFAPGAYANQADIAEALDLLAGVHQVDLVNLSLGSSGPSAILHDAIQDALEGGTLCLCAAGNEGTPVADFPAAWPDTVAVAALGREGWGPCGSTSSMNYPSDAGRFGDDRLYLTRFSNYGPQVECCAPGNGIISTIPAKRGAPYLAMDGTSMAAPIATGVLAIHLSRDAAYQTLPRDLTRAQRARAILHNHCRDILLDPVYQGRGLVSAG